MGVLYLSIEIAFDILILVTGGIIAIQAKDNLQKRYWGIISFCIGAVFLWENIGWLRIVSETPTYHFTDLLSIEKMLKWYIPASIVCLFPIASLRPGYLTPFKILSFMLFPIITTTIGVCYSEFNGYFTPITSLSQILPNLGKTDIQLRCVIFLLTITTPLFLTIYPMISLKAYRKMNKAMYLFMGFMFTFLCIYILFTLNINKIVFNLFGIAAIVFTLSFSIEYLLYENPFSYYDDGIGEQGQTAAKPLPEEKSGSHHDQSSPLFIRIEDILRQDNTFTNKNYSLKDLSKSMGEKECVLSDAIKSAGYTSFREYICDLRMEYFKQQAEANPGKYVKELMFECGFTSRSTFYRNFTKRFGESPSKYMEK